MSMNVTQKLIQAHLVYGNMQSGEEIGISIDQTLTQDATGTLVMLEFEAMGLDRVKTEVSVQYVDHNIIQEDFKNPDDHLFLRSACQRFGLWYSRPGNGVSHPCHQENFGKPGKTLLGSDSHTPAGGAIGMLAIGAGGLEVALAMAGEPFFTRMPQIWGVKLTGSLPDWVSAKDVILEMLRRHGVDGGVGRIIEYYGPGLATLSAMDRHVIANMGAELGATSSVFPSDQEVRRFLRAWQREEDWVELVADTGASYDLFEEIDLSSLVPLIAMPSSPGNVHPVSEVAGQRIYQTYIGSSANPGFRDFAVSALMVRGRKVHDRVSFDINPTSRAQLETLVRDGHIADLLHAGARLHQAGCNGCIGMGQAPATNELSLRTVPRNFPGRSGTREDKVCLVSPETATASALTGVITDPRTLGIAYPRVMDPDHPIINREMFGAPLPLAEALKVDLVKGPNIASLPPFAPLPDEIEVPVLLKTGNDVSTDEIMPPGLRVLPFRSNIAKIAEFSFDRLDPTYAVRAKQVPGHIVVGGSNYGQGSSREHAALGPQYLGLRAVLAKGFARIHAQNLINFGVLPLTFIDPADYDGIQAADLLRLTDLKHVLTEGGELVVVNVTRQVSFQVRHHMSPRQVQFLLSGGLINWMKERLTAEGSAADRALASD
ncbi:aconitate hydratase [Pseudomonas sp. RTC3]|uniref:aconitate hydratase n=1 Tax=unclassified Pseudomonas TaxID=196821 RepID=UPI002AB3CC4F|nr:MULTISPECIES: aconitate hydratase [unclassified Pseudomonas]MEB0063872.1 aconitate hydratase [Pseudomonas sp. RTC3]MDY7565025.1 aconitate hydratase [Pseudomonas sp. 5C2]MEB0025252.1 aconitate hydratase [Pseudomonas sp. MH9.2]MEB0242190.1 aconitate hydratase [Pseudomonas sp. 5C2]WPX69142.1 aconitate hydratase [Pseudomonas sp. MH9.2]